jgi:hypothetical protein
MPTYKVTDPTTGKTLRLTGDSPPTEQELSEVFARVNQGAAPTQPAAQAPERTWTDTATDVAVGAAKGVGNTVAGLGQLAYDYLPGVSAVSDAVQRVAFGDVIPGNQMIAGARQGVLAPTNTPQRVGFAGEQIGEFLVPAAKAGVLAKVPGVARVVPRAIAGAQAAGLTAAQGGTGTEAGVSGALTAAIPGGATLKKGAGALQQGAEKEMAQALGATKEWAKSDAAKLAPGMLQRGVRGSRAAMLEQAKSAAQRAGSELDNAYTAAAQAGSAVDGTIIRGNIQLARDALMTTNAAGRRVGIPGTEGVIGKLDELEQFVATLGPDIPVDKAAHVKRTWDAIVSKAGLFGPKATASATDSANAWAIREASNSFRQLLNANPTIEALNQEAAFWTGLKKVLKETQKRTQAQANTGLVAAGVGGAGAVVGGMSGDSTSERALLALAGGAAGRNLVKLVQSPSFRTSVSGPAKQKLADALASGNSERIASAVGRIVASLSSPQTRDALVE